MGSREKEAQQGGAERSRTLAITRKAMGSREKEEEKEKENEQERGDSRGGMRGVGVQREKRPLWRGEDHKMGSRTSEAVRGCFKAMIVGQQKNKQKQQSGEGRGGTREPDSQRCMMVDKIV